MRGGLYFALNHMVAPGIAIPQLIELARTLGIEAIEIRNDLPGNAILDGTPPDVIRSQAARHRIRILSINALQRFNEWNEQRAAEARKLIHYAVACGAQALVLVPTNDGTGCANGERQGRLRIALKQLHPMLQDAGIMGLVEPLGFATSSLRSKAEAAEAIRSLDVARSFRLVHDTFHHHLASEPGLYPDLTGLVHISGVSDRNIGISEMRDSHRVLVDDHDRLDNIGQILALTAAGYDGAFSFEPFAKSLHALKDASALLRDSIAFINRQTARQAARSDHSTAQNSRQRG